MSTAYYYFAASLPTLMWGGELPFSLASFLEDCQRLLRDEDYQQVLIAVEMQDGPARNPLLVEWRSFSDRLLREAVWRRAEALGRELGAGQVRPQDPEAQAVLTEATRAADPLRAEQGVDLARWRKIEDLAQGHLFDLEFILSYAVRLRILDRYQRIAGEQGRQVLAAWQAQVQGRDF